MIPAKPHYSDIGDGAIANISTQATAPRYLELLNGDEEQRGKNRHHGQDWSLSAREVRSS